MLTEFLKYLGLVALPFTMYFAWTKVGHKVGATYSWHVGKFSSSGIGTVTLINMKDRPLAIFEIHAVMDDLSFHIKEFSPPLILKAMEAICVDADPVSNRRVGGKTYDWQPRIGRADEIEIFLSTSSKTIKCHRQGPPSRLGFAMKHKLRLVVDERMSFNGVMYNEKTRYAITYTDDGEQKTALIDMSGFINWGYLPNALRPEDMRSVETVRDALASCGIERIVSPFVVDELNNREPQKRKSAGYSLPAKV